MIEIIEQYKKEGKPIKLNLACGWQKQEGFIGVDKYKTDITDIVHDLEIYPWPFEDNYVDEIICNHYIEHTKDLIKFIDSIYRIMKKPYTNDKGEEIKPKCTIVAPYYTSMRAYQDPTHKRAICEATFLYFNKKWREDNKLTHGDYDIKSDFDFSYGYVMQPDYINRSEEHRNFAISHYWNVVSDIQIILIKR